MSRVGTEVEAILVGASAGEGRGLRRNLLHGRSQLTSAPKRVEIAGFSFELGTATSTSISDSVRAYLKEIGRMRLLTADQEVALGRCIKLGDAAARRLATLEALEAAEASGTPLPPASIAEKASLESSRAEDERLRREGALARQVLIQANLRLVVSVAKWYRNRGLSFLDMVQEGNLGLMRAVERFDYERGFKFSTYAMWWIRQAINRAIADQARMIRIPVHALDAMNAVLTAQRSLAQESGRQPTLDEVAERAEMAPERVREILRLSQDTLSLELPLGEEEFNICDTIEDEETPSPSEAATRAMLALAVREVLAELTERERDLVRLRFGLDDGNARTLDEVGRAFGVTRERVRQIESKALAKLRQPVFSGPLREYLVG
jgi:RNA polymerase primary sigma factor